MKTFAVCAGLLAAFFITACGYETEPTLTSKLQGTWVSNDPDAIYSGTLIINNDRITISGYSENQTPSPSRGGDDNKRPFRDFTKGTALKWHSEEDKLFIEDRGKVQDGIPYYYYEGDLWYDSSSSSSYKADKFLCFSFGGRDEILENLANH